MKRSTLVRHLVVALAVSAAAVAVPPAAAETTPPGGDTAAGGDAAAGATAGTTVTLITGDRVTVDGGGRHTVARGAGRDGVTFATRRERGHLHVVPSDAYPLLRDDRLDPRLFDVTMLIESGYDDRRDTLPLIVTAPGTAPLAARAPLAGATVTGASGDGFRAVRAERTGELWSAVRDGAAPGKIWLDGVRRPALDVSVPQIGAPVAWQTGLTGAGTTVAVLDTGIDTTHPDLAGQVRAARNFTEGAEDDRDTVGHGTHVASTIAGTGAASNGRYRGVAPGAALLDGKVCVWGTCAESWILAGMQWAAEQGADVVNMSLLGWDAPGVDPLEQAVETLTARHGTLFVAATGNDGADRGVGSPATADSALAVGAVDRHEALAWFSNRGPRPDGLAVKPEITGPGVDIVAAKSRDARATGAEPAPGYVTFSGTSMATPHVAGAAAILAQQHADWTPAQLKAALIASARPNPETGVYGQGAGRVDVARAITQTVSATPATLSFGVQRWPHADDVARSETLTYHNTGAAPVTLTFGTEAPVPAGLVRFSPPSVTVAPGRTAQVTVTVDTSGDLPEGVLGGNLTATAGDLVVRTPFAVDREVESYDVDVTVLGRDGAPAGLWGLSLYDTVTGDWRHDHSWQGGTTARLPKGTYAMLAQIFAGEEQIMVAQPVLTVDRATTLTIDGAAAKPVAMTVPEPDAALVYAQVGVGIGAELQGGIITGDLSTVFTLGLGPDSSTPRYASFVNAAFAREGVTDSPYQYSLLYLTPGRLFTGFSHAVRRRELATVTAVHAEVASSGTASKGAYPVHESIGGAYGESVPYTTLPFTRTEHYNADHGVRWRPYFHEAGLLRLTAGPTAYRPGRSTTEHWNRAVAGPSHLVPWVTRDRDTITVTAGVFGDGAGHLGTPSRADLLTRLYRDGALVAEGRGVETSFPVPAGGGAYRLEISGTRPARLSTGVSASWTFTSARTDTRTPVPLSAVVFTPEVDDHGVAPKGRATTVPLRVDGPALTAAPTVEVSFDDGRTWTRRPVRGGAVEITHPDRAGFVSLRATAPGLTQTVIRAYEIR